VELRTERLSSGYGDRPVIRDVDIRVSEGCVTALFGPNGAGKSTLLKTIFGMLPPLSGRVLLDGDDVTGLEPAEMLKRGVAYVPQERSIFPDLTVEENLKMAGWLIRGNRSLLRKRIEEIFTLFPVLEKMRTKKSILLSGGQQRMLEVARALMLAPQIIVMDEPSAGLAPNVLFELLSMVSGLKNAGKTIFIVDQNIREAVKIADYVYVLERGEVTFEGGVNTFMKSMEDLVRSWLKF